MGQTAGDPDIPSFRDLGGAGLVSKFMKLWRICKGSLLQPSGCNTEPGGCRGGLWPKWREREFGGSGKAMGDHVSAIEMLSGSRQHDLGVGRMASIRHEAWLVS